jgi:hypothetical protein
MSTGKNINFIETVIPPSKGKKNTEQRTIKFEITKNSKAIKNNCVWTINGKEYCRKDAVEIEGISNCVVRTDKKTIPIPQKLFKKRFLKKSPLPLGQNTGIKFENNDKGVLRVIKLTLVHRTDVRYIATKIYRNNSNNYLIMFDEESDHQKIENMIRLSSTGVPQIKIIAA